MEVLRLAINRKGKGASVSLWSARLDGVNQANRASRGRQQFAENLPGRLRPMGWPRVTKGGVEGEAKGSGRSLPGPSQSALVANGL